MGAQGKFPVARRAGKNRIKTMVVVLGKCVGSVVAGTIDNKDKWPSKKKRTGPNNVVVLE